MTAPFHVAYYMTIKQRMHNLMISSAHVTLPHFFEIFFSKYQLFLHTFFAVHKWEVGKIYIIIDNITYNIIPSYTLRWMLI